MYYVWYYLVLCLVEFYFQEFPYFQTDHQGLQPNYLSSVKSYAQGERVYCRFFSISMECKDLQVYFPTINYITIEKLKEFNLKATGRFYNEDFKVLDHDHDWVLMTKARSKSNILKDKILDIELHKMEATEET
ncbi:hypothetical protein H5410_006243 [Solanum commersonii]|uniref:Uncharacterized protein n=1 Tax=Solanum commersonii TaxID=4109 RepID=A0A9J6A964_SOLCO|nr:hypothetical protein H5410_006243 [Solanum commersonii]